MNNVYIIPVNFKNVKIMKKVMLVLSVMLFMICVQVKASEVAEVAETIETVDMVSAAAPPGTYYGSLGSVTAREGVPITVKAPAYDITGFYPSPRFVEGYTKTATSLIIELGSPAHVEQLGTLFVLVNGGYYAIYLNWVN